MTMQSRELFCTNLLFGLLLMLILPTGCSSVEKAPVSSWNSPVFIPVFYQDQDEYVIERRGWWFSSEDYFQVDNIGFVLAEHLRQKLHNDGIPVLNYQQTRHFQNIYLEKHGMTEECLTYLDWSRIIGSPYVLMGKIHRAGTAHNRTIHAWYVDITVEVFFQDAKSGEVLYHETHTLKNNFQSLTTALQELSGQITEDLFVKALTEEA